MSEELLEIQCWSDNNSSHSSRREDMVEVERSKWVAMTQEERWAYVRREMAANDHFEYGFQDPLK